MKILLDNWKLWFSNKRKEKGEIMVLEECFDGTQIIISRKNNKIVCIERYEPLSNPWVDKEIIGKERKK